MSRDLAQDWLARALALCDVGRPADADEALREALREEPDDPLTHGIHALVLLDLDRPKEALESASTAIALAPELSLGHMARTRALLSLERFERGGGFGERGDPARPGGCGHARPARVRAAGPRAMGRGARRCGQGAVAGARVGERARSAGGRARDVGARARGGREAASETLAVAPDSALAHGLAGQAHLIRGGEREAAERFREALRLDPESEFAQAGLAEAMKAAHPLFKPLFRFFMWQERLSTGWRVALIVGPLLALRALRPAADNPVVLALIVLWIAFVVADVAGRPDRERRASLFQRSAAPFCPRIRSARPPRSSHSSVQLCSHWSSRLR